MNWTPELRIPVDEETELVPTSLTRADEFMAVINSCRGYLREWMAWLDATRTVEELCGFLTLTRRERNSKKSLALWMCQRGAIRGIIHLREIDWTNRRAMIGYWVAEAARGRGLAKRAARALCTYAFEDLGLHRIEIRCAPTNTASQAIPRALGFRPEGVLRECEWLYDHFVDNMVFGMTAPEWKISR